MRAAMPKPPQLTKHEIRLLDRLKHGSVLCCEVDGTEEGLRNQGRRWFLEQGGSVVGPTEQDVVEVFYAGGSIVELRT